MKLKKLIRKYNIVLGERNDRRSGLINIFHLGRNDHLLTFFSWLSCSFQALIVHEEEREVTN